MQDIEEYGLPARPTFQMRVGTQGRALTVALVMTWVEN